MRSDFESAGILISDPLPHKCGVPVVAERRVYAAAAVQNLKMRIAVGTASFLDFGPQTAILARISWIES